MMDSTREQERAENTRMMPRERAFGRRIDCAERELPRSAVPSRAGMRETSTWHGRAGDHRG